MLVSGAGSLTPAAGGFSIDNSLRFNDDDTAYLSKTFASAGNQKTFTWSGWVKLNNTTDRAFFGATTGANSAIKTKGSKIQFEQYGSGTNYYIKTSAVLRDFSAWYHIVAVWDSSNSTSSDRIRLYINGERATDLAASDYPALNYDHEINSASEHRVGHDLSADRYMDGYMAEVHFIDGTALTPSSFGETGDYGEWKAKKVSGLTYGTNGFYLDFKVAGTGTTGAGKDVSGKGNHWSTSGIASTDQMIDTPTNNFCTWNSIDPTPEGIANTITEGNLQVRDSSGGYNWVIATQGMSSGKWYWEVYIDTTYNYQIIGVHAGTDTSRSQSHLGGESDGWGWQWYDGRAYNSDSYVSTGTATTGDIVQVAVDMDAGKIWWGKNNTWENSGNPSTGTSPIYSGLPSFLQPAFSIYGANSTNRITTNFGQDSSFAGGKTTGSANANDGTYGDFYYTPPSGFLALCTSNLTAPAVIPSEHFNTVLYAGDSASSHAITGAGFQPDFTWIKRRSGGSHKLFDVIRGATKQLYSDVTSAEVTDANTLKSFDSDGFTVGTNYDVNNSAHTFVAWNWKANGTGASNTNGSITSTVSANVDAGFSISTYTGTGSNATVGHGLSSAPDMVIVKRRNSAEEWLVLHETLTATKHVKLSTTGSAITQTNIWNDTNPTDSVFSLGTVDPINGSGGTFVAYCFHSVDGYSKVGSYTGNGSSDGTFVYTGFRPAFILYKHTTSAENWWIHDSERAGYNPDNWSLPPNSSQAEVTGAYGPFLDIVSNGFKCISTDGRINSNNATYIYIAFAESPFKYSNAK